MNSQYISFISCWRFFSKNWKKSLIESCQSNRCNQYKLIKRIYLSLNSHVLSQAQMDLNWFIFILKFLLFCISSHTNHSTRLQFFIKKSISSKCHSKFGFKGFYFFPAKVGRGIFKLWFYFKYNLRL